MRWRQFFTPVKSSGPDEAKQSMDRLDGDEYTLLDVRQPKEYQAGHIPGAKLIPLPELNDRLEEIDPAKPTYIY